jgi:hypothetical protein
MSEFPTTPDVPEAFTDLVAQFGVLPSERKHIAAYEYARDIAYGDIGSRNPFDVLKAHKGTCSGKHALLKKLLEELGYEVQSWFAKHDFGKFPIAQWPTELQDFKDKDIPDYHDFLKVKVGDDWQTIDAVFDAPLKDLGFPKLEWDGKASMALPVIASDLFPAEGDMEEHKKKLIAGLPEDAQQRRKQFLSAMTKWLDEQRAK